MTERLLDLLRRRANRHGLVMARQPQLLEELGASAEDLLAALAALAQSGTVRVLSPLPYLVVALLPRPWSGSRPHRVRNAQQVSHESRRAQEEVPVSGSIAAAAIQPREVGGVGEGEVVLDQVLAALGPEADRDEFQAILAGHSPELIRRCLRRVEATKAIRVSRAALFRSLLQRFSH